MLVADIPAASSGISHRVLLLGSCRIRNPFLKLTSAGRGKYLFGAPPLSHTSSEALQTLRYFGYELSIPEHCSRFIFENDSAPARSAFAASLIENADTIVIEVCDKNLVMYRDVVFQANYFARQFVQRYGRPILDWYREISRGNEPSEQTITATLDRLAEAGQVASEGVADVLRNTRMTQETPQLRRRNLKALMKDQTKRYVIVSHFVVPGEGGAIMSDRALLRDDLAELARETGAIFFDPGVLIAEAGREVALDAGGTDIYEYNPNFNIIIGDKIAEVVRNAWQNRPETLGMRRRRATVEMLSKAKSINDQLVRFADARLAERGLSESGLYEHYKRLLDQRDLVAPRIPAAQAICEFLPRFGRYVVLRAGLGELGFVIAAAGAPVDMFEGTRTRLRAIRDFAIYRPKSLDEAPITIEEGLVPNGEYFGLPDVSSG